MTWYIEEFRACYNAVLHVNIKITTSQQRWYLLLNYFNNKNQIIFVQLWNSFLKFAFLSVWHMSNNTAQSNTLVHSNVTNKLAKFGAKIFGHFWDMAIFVLGYFSLPHPVSVLLMAVIVEEQVHTSCQHHQNYQLHQLIHVTVYLPYSVSPIILIFHCCRCCTDSKRLNVFHIFVIETNFQLTFIVCLCVDCSSLLFIAGSRVSVIIAYHHQLLCLCFSHWLHTGLQYI